MKYLLSQLLPKRERVSSLQNHASFGSNTQGFPYLPESHLSEKCVAQRRAASRSPVEYIKNMAIYKDIRVPF